MNKLINNKKGNFADIVLYIAIGFVFVFSVVLTYMLLHGFNNALPNIEIANNTQDAMSVSNSLVSKFPSAFDWILPVIYLVFLIFTIWSASLIESTNKFFVIGIFISFLLVFFSLMMENMWNEFKNQAMILPYLTDFRYTVFIMDNLRYFTLFFCFVVMVLLYARRD